VSNYGMSSRTLQIFAGLAVFIQMIWFDPTESGYLPTVFSYFGHYFSVYELLLYVFPLIGIAIFIGIWKLQSWAWAMSAILSLFVLFQLWVYWYLGQVSRFWLLQILAVLICCIGAFAAKREHVIGRKDIIAVTIALVMAIPIIYIKSNFFRSISIEYDRPIPGWIEIWDHSNFVGTKAVFLWWILYWAIVVVHRATSSVFRKRNGL
jgi:hypothetical protein